MGSNIQTAYEVRVEGEGRAGLVFSNTYDYLYHMHDQALSWLPSPDTDSRIRDKDKYQYILIFGDK